MSVTTTERRRAHSIEEFKQIQGRIFGKLPGSKLEVRPTDVIITPFGKSGTTWLQQMFHTLRTGGDMDFDDISRVVPWLEISPVLGLDINAEQRANPRGFKSHATYENLPKGCRYINSVRNPKDVAWSMFKFMEGWFIEPGTVQPDQFVRETFLASGDYYKHLLSWWRLRDSAQVLFLAYEHTKQDLPAAIHRVADFCDIPMNEKLLSITLEQTSLNFMQDHKNRFDDAMIRHFTEQEVLPGGSDSAKVRTGQIGEHKTGLGDAILRELDDKWAAEITPVLGFSSYDELIRSL